MSVSESSVWPLQNGDDDDDDDDKNGWLTACSAVMLLEVVSNGCEEL